MNGISQDSNEVKGDLAAGNITKNTNLHFGDTSEKKSQMSILLNKFKTEQSKNQDFKTIIEALEHYRNPLENEPVIGLEAKLLAADRGSFLEYGLRVKEQYAKKLLKHQFSESAQQINVHLLALVESYFMNNIYPLIYKGESEIIINSMITEFIVKPLQNELEENHLGFTVQDINGMLYFLTGNCHIKWTK